VYETIVVEKHLETTRSTVWESFLESLLEGGGYRRLGDPRPHGPGAQRTLVLDGQELTVETLSFEPPWRWVDEVVGDAPVRLLQRTLALRDDGSECHVASSTLIELEPGRSVGRFLDAVATTAIEAVEDLKRRSGG
jgi:hypothetical protein